MSEALQAALAALAGGQVSAPPSSAHWLDARRAQALERANALTVPTPRDEAWRFTDLSPLYRRSFQPAASPGELAGDFVSRVALPEARARLVFVDGHYSPSLSTPADGALFAGSLADALVRRGEVLESHLAAGVADADVFASINTAFLQQAAVVVVPAGEAPSPVHVLHVATRPDAIQYARLLVVCAPGSAGCVVEEYASPNDGGYFVNAVAEIVVGEGARLAHVRVQRDAAAAFHIASAAARVARDGRYTAQSLALGARISRHTPSIVMAGEGAAADIDGLALIGDRQLADTHSLIDHVAGHCRTRQLHKCIADDASHAVFNGRIVVRRGAQRTDSAQQSRNLLLTGRAHVDTKPQLEIFADDVKCAHGAAVGQLDAEQLFYLKARGLDERTARNLLTYAFAAEVFGRIPVASLRARLERLVLARTHLRETETS